MALFLRDVGRDVGQGRNREKGKGNREKGKGNREKGKGKGKGGTRGRLPTVTGSGALASGFDTDQASPSSTRLNLGEV